MRKLFFLIYPLIGLALLTGCQSKEKTLKVAATSVPHAELLEIIKPELESQGIHLTIVEVDDYNLPNRLLFEKQVDANFFQHQPFLEEQNQRFGYHLVPIAKVHIEPLGIFSQKLSSLETLQEGAIIGIPNDPTNEARALTLLQEVGLIELKEGFPGSLATILDIKDNPKHLKIEEVNAAFLPRTLVDVDLAVIPSNFALSAHLNPVEEALAIEAQDSPYANVLVVREGEEQREDLQKFKAALTSEKMRKVILEKYQGAIVPAY